MHNSLSVNKNKAYFTVELYILPYPNGRVWGSPFTLLLYENDI